MTWKRATLADSLGDNLVYRNLEPQQPGIPGLRAAWAEIGLDHYYVPRKTAPEYAAALMCFLHQAQRARGVSAPLERLLFIGDTLMLDGTAAHNVGAYLPLRGFIGADRLQEPAKREIREDLMVANRWGALADFVAWAREPGVLDERTALLVDLDKTFLGARGRNDKVIDRARVQAVMSTMRAALGDQLDEAAFRQVYDPLNQPDYHYFTADNQDYLAYICLMVIGGVMASKELWQRVNQGSLRSFDQFVAACDERRATMSAALLTTHQEVHQGLLDDDPTPFKAFRRREYVETVSLMNVLADGADAGAVLASEIVITAEVASVLNHLRDQGVLVFGISDKPDEASLPTSEHATQGYRPLHHTTMKVYGQELS
jgi:hypothetical protein